MKKYYSPITLSSKKLLILKTIAEIKKINNYKENLKYIDRKLKLLFKNSINHEISNTIIKEEIELSLKYKHILNVKITESFIEKLLKLDNKLFNTKTIELILSVYIAIEHIRVENIYLMQNKRIQDLTNDYLKNKDVNFNNWELTDNEYKHLELKYCNNPNALSKFKKTISFYFYTFFKETKEDSEEMAKSITWLLFNDTKKSNYIRLDEEIGYQGKYISFR